MKKIPKVLYRYRLITSTLALVLLLGALVVTPAQDTVIEGGGQTCETGCISWNQQQGCVQCLKCCVKDTGEWGCWLVSTNWCS